MSILKVSVSRQQGWAPGQDGGWGEQELAGIGAGIKPPLSQAAWADKELGLCFGLSWDLPRGISREVGLGRNLRGKSKGWVCIS